MARARPSVHESWAMALHEALVGMADVLVAQIVPGSAGYELVLTMRHSPPGAGAVDALGRALGPVLDRDDSPVAGDGWHFYPPICESERTLLDGLDWRGAVVLHEWVEEA